MNDTGRAGTSTACLAPHASPSCGSDTLSV